MLITKLKLHNWMNIQDCDLDFHLGMNIIQGKVGEGKSAVFAALGYALSDYKRGDSWKDFVTTGQDYFEINLIVRLGETEDTTMRLYYRGELKKGSVYKEINYGTDPKRTGEEVPIFLAQHLDQHMLSSVIFNLQGSKKLSEMTPAERRDIFKKMFNSDFSATSDLVKEDIKNIKEKITMSEATLNVLRNKEYTFFRIIPVDESELPKLQEELKQAHLAESVYLRLAQYTEKLNSLNSTAMKRDREQSSLSTYKSNIQKLDIKNSEIVNNLTNHTIKYSELEVRVQELEEEYEAMCNKVEEDTDISNDKIKVLEKESIDKQNELISVKTELAVVTRHLSTHKKGICDSCGSECDITKIPYFESLITQYTQQEVDIQKSLQDIKNTIKTLQEAIQGMKIALDIKIKEKTITIQNRDRLGNEIVALKAELSNLSNNSNMIQESVDQSLGRILEYSTTISEIEKWLVDNPKPQIVDSKDVSVIQATIDALHERIQGNINKKVMNDNITREQKENEVEIERLNIEVNSLNLEKTRLDNVVTLFNADFPNFINTKACNLLEGYMNGFFATTKDQFQVSLQSTEKGVSFYYKSDSVGDWRNIKMTSGYESALSTLGFKVGVAVSFGSSFIVLDEPEANADPESSEKLFTTIGDDVNQFKQVFLISHKKEIMQRLVYDYNAHGYYVNKGKFNPMEE